ncbi:MAG: hypothetical protein RBU30_17735 [Polyangia bacterium]|jgi:DNA repair exonuclease SbcCD ATPase subunit|nr:hypothetical protein [Polyangia bacterium]
MSKLTPAENLQRLRAEEQILENALARLSSEQSGLARQASSYCASSGVEGRLYRARASARRWEGTPRREMSDTVDPLPSVVGDLPRVIGHGWTFKRGEILASASEEAARLADRVAQTETAMDTATTSTAYEESRRKAEQARRQLVAHELVVRLVEASRDEDRRRLEDLQQWAQLAEQEAARRQRQAEEAQERLTPSAEKLDRVQSRLAELRSELEQAEAVLIEGI